MLAIARRYHTGIRSYVNLIRLPKARATYSGCLIHIQPNLVAAHTSDDCAPWPKSAAILHSSCTVGKKREVRVETNLVSLLESERIGGRGRDRTGDPLLAKHGSRLQPLHPLLLTTNVSNKSGNLLLAQRYPQLFENVGFLHSPRHSDAPAFWDCLAGNPFSFCSKCAR